MSIYNSNCDFNKYRVFYAVAECLSFSKATELLHISQPAISYSIKELEEQLETKLFIRNGKQITLTEDGEKLFIYVEKAFNNIVMAERIIKEKDNLLTGKVRIGVYSHIATLLLPKLMNEFSKLHPKARFVIYSSSDIEIKEKLKNKELDLAILHYPIFTDEDIYCEEKLFTLHSCFFGNKSYYDMILDNKKKIVEYPLILPMKGFIDTIDLEKTLKKNNIILKPAHRVYATELKKELAINGLGICWGQKEFIEKEIKNGELYCLPIDVETPDMPVSIAYDPRYLNKTAKEFLKMLKNYFNKKQ